MIKNINIEPHKDERLKPFVLVNACTIAFHLEVFVAKKCTKQINAP